MKARGQVLVIVAVLLTIGMLLLALIVDAGRLYIEQDELDRSAQAAADAGIGWVAEQMLTQAIPRQTAAASLPPCVPDADFGSSRGECTATPAPERIPLWLEDDDLATLMAPAIQLTAQSIARSYAAGNGLTESDPETEQLVFQYPHNPDPQSDALAMSVQVRRRAIVLLAGLLSDSYVHLEGRGLSEIPLR
jgi:hypothetical protein